MTSSTQIVVTSCTDALASDDGEDAERLVQVDGEFQGWQKLLLVKQVLELLLAVKRFGKIMHYT